MVFKLPKLAIVILIVLTIAIYTNMRHQLKRAEKVISRCMDRGGFRVALDHLMVSNNNYLYSMCNNCTLDFFSYQPYCNC